MDSAKKIKNLLIGDGSEENYYLACTYFNEPVYLLDNSTYNNLDLNLSYYTSPKDLELDKLLHTTEIVENLRFGNFKILSDNAESVILNFILYKSRPNDYTNLIGKEIKIDQDEIVFIGCSHTKGIGVENNQRFSFLASQNLGLKEKNLGIGGSGIWQVHDTFFRCKFHKNQKVVIQISDPYRFNYFQNQTIEHSSFKNVTNKKLVLTYNDQILSYQEYSLINSIILASKNYNIDLVCFRMSMALPSDYNESDYLISANTKSFLLGEWLDLGSDNCHSGPLTHKKISSIIIDKFKGNI